MLAPAPTVLSREEYEREVAMWVAAKRHIETYERKPRVPLRRLWQQFRVRLRTVSASTPTTHTSSAHEGSPA